MDTLEKNTIGGFVTQNFRTAAVFSKYGIDFCCKGQRTLQEVCQSENIDEKELLLELDAVLEIKDTTDIDFSAWPIDKLADHIQENHHRYVEEKIPVLLELLEKTCTKHGSKHRELIEIYVLFKGSADELIPHMKKEELILFPYIKEMIAKTKSHDSLDKPHFNTVKNPIDEMMNDHDAEGERFRRIAQLTNNYTPPIDACDTYKIAFAMLQEFEQDLHQHVHLESNILFPNAKALEKFITTEE